MRVVKVGGSLFDLPDLKSRLQNWLAEHNDMPNVLIAGGGKPVDAIREFQTTHGISDCQAHWLSIKTMSTTAEMLGTLLPKAEVVTEIELLGIGNQPTTIFSPFQWLQQKTAADPKFCEQSWNVTSDSISVLTGLQLQANEIVLLKSADFKEDDSDFLDVCFAGLARRFKSVPNTNLTIINFKSLERWQLVCVGDDLVGVPRTATIR